MVNAGPHKYSNTKMLTCMFCKAINACMCALSTAYMYTPIQREPIKAQTANLGVSLLLNDLTNEQLPHSHYIPCKDDLLQVTEWMGGGVRVSMICYDYGNGSYAMKMMRYFPIVP